MFEPASSELSRKESAPDMATETYCTARIRLLGDGHQTVTLYNGHAQRKAVYRYTLNPGQNSARKKKKPERASQGRHSKRCGDHAQAELQPLAAALVRLCRASLSEIYFIDDFGMLRELDGVGDWRSPRSYPHEASQLAEKVQGITHAVRCRENPWVLSDLLSSGGSMTVLETVPSKPNRRGAEDSGEIEDVGVPTELQAPIAEVRPECQLHRCSYWRQRLEDLVLCGCTSGKRSAAARSSTVLHINIRRDCRTCGGVTQVLLEHAMLCSRRDCPAYFCTEFRAVEEAFQRARTDLWMYRHLRLTYFNLMALP